MTFSGNFYTFSLFWSFSVLQFQCFVALLCWRFAACHLLVVSFSCRFAILWFCCFVLLKFWCFPAYLFWWLVFSQLFFLALMVTFFHSQNSHQGSGALRFIISADDRLRQRTAQSNPAFWLAEGIFHVENNYPCKVDNSRILTGRLFLLTKIYCLGWRYLFKFVL